MVDDYFAATFSDARGRFLQASLQAGAEVVSHRHPLAGPSGELLCADVAHLGSGQAEHVVFVTSATHGIEGYCGSGIQVGLLTEATFPRPIPEDRVALVLIHALNPFGFAWTRRVNEDNVDLNRNFVDHANQDYPENDLFEVVADAMIPERWDEAAIAACESVLDAARAAHGKVEIRKAMGKGQYRHPTNMAYGGNHATWSNRLLHEVCGTHLHGARSGVLIDLHSGLGPYGYGELMTRSQPGDADFDLLFDWYGDQVHSTTAGASAYSGSKGSILAGFRPAGPGQRWRCGGFGIRYPTPGASFPGSARGPLAAPLRRSQQQIGPTDQARSARCVLR